MTEDREQMTEGGKKRRWEDEKVGERIRAEVLEFGIPNVEGGKLRSEVNEYVWWSRKKSENSELSNFTPYDFNRLWDWKL